jgi:hypothetical protein
LVGARDRVYGGSGDGEAVGAVCPKVEMVVEAGEVELSYWSVGGNEDRLECGSRPKRAVVSMRGHYGMSTMN